MKQLESVDETAARLSYHPGSLKRLSRQGKFPKMVRLANNKNAFVTAEVDEWIAARIKDRETAA